MTKDEFIKFVNLWHPVNQAHGVRSAVAEL
jgi:hypothetical protein